MIVDDEITVGKKVSFIIHKELLKYWNLNLEENRYMDINERNINPLHSISREEYYSGKISDFTQLAKHCTDENSELFICPKLYRKKEYQENGESTYVYSVWLVIPAKVTSTGELVATRQPFIPRKYLRPSKGDLTFSSLERVERYWKDHPFPTNPSWKRTLEICEDFSRRVLDNVISLITLGTYQELKEVIIFDANECLGSATDRHVKNFYENHIVNKYSKKKYTELCKKSPLVSKLFLPKEELQQGTLSNHETMALKHLGQIKNKDPLTESQRKALHHFLALQDGELLSIEGPPGTGKTTLLQSVFASMWVCSALDQSDVPPVLLASGGTNLAITNILKTFDENIELKRDQFPSGDHFHNIELLTKRWIPDVKSLGTYCIAPSKQGDHQDYQLIFYDKESLKTNWIHFEELDEQDIKRYEKAFLNATSRYFGFSIPDIKSARQLLHARLQTAVGEINEVMGVLTEDYLTAKQIHELLKEYKAESLDQVLSHWSNQLNDLEKEKQAIEAKMYAWDKHKGIRKPLEKFLLRLPVVNKFFEKWFVYANQRFVDRVLSSASIPSYEDTTIETYLEELEKECNQKICQLTAKKAKAEELKQRNEQAQNELTHLQEKYKKYKEEIPMDLFRAQEAFDKMHRVLAFHLSTHYWEARWIERAKERILQKQGKFSDRKDFYREVAMLTPCFVSTMYMAPVYFNEKYNYFYGFADLLIIDEASQVLPQYMFPVLSFAKKGLVVGDSKQLPPISNLSRERCEVNIKEAGLHKTSLDIEAMGLHQPDGSMLKLANYLTRYLDEDLKPFMLKEHFRCHPSIAKYFNQLFYGKNLIVRSGQKSPYSIPNLGFVDIEGQEEPSGSSRINHIEAATIALWIQDFFDLYNIKEDKQKDTLAVLTPFAQQARVIRKYLKELGIDQIVVGTVHSLQGAEFDVVVFSPTYTSITDQHFFDREPYILNVAASRAKKAFLTFGDLRYIGVNRNEPSGKLRKMSVLATETAFAPALPEEVEVNDLLERMKKDFYRELPEKTHQIYKMNIVNSIIDRSQFGMNENATLYT